MIEFKAECGHTVRAKDDDAGGVVRCSYCGREANVPDEHGDGLDFLFNDVEQQDTQPVSKRRRRAKPKRVRPPGSFNPFSVVIRLCYAALLIAIVIVVGRKWVLPLFKGDGLERIVKPQRDEPPVPPTTTPENGDQRRVPPGLIDREHLVGLYVSSTPPGALAFCVKESDAPAAGRIHQVRGATRFRADGNHPNVPDGNYVVELLFPWNDPSLTRHEGYTQFRRSIQAASNDERIRLVEEYFIPDEATAVFVDETDEQLYIVRQYRDIQVRDKQSSGVRGLFLPKLYPPGAPSFSVEALLAGSYIPNRKAYAFDEGYVSGELDYYQVPAQDQRFVLEALSRIGVIPYVTPSQKTRLFKIGVYNGTFSAKVVRE